MVSARTQKRMAILKLEGVNSIEQADLLRNRVFIPQAARILSWSRAGILFRIC